MSETIKNETSGVEVETVSSASTTENVKKLDTLIAVYYKGVVMEKIGMAVKLATLAIIDKTKLYTAKGYKTTAEFAENELNLGKKTAQLYLQTVKKFYDVEKLAENNTVIDLVDDNGEFKNVENFKMVSVLADNEGNDFSPATLTRIRSLEVDTLKELLSKAILTYDMTDREIKEVVKPYRKNAQKDIDNTQDTDNDNDNEENDNEEKTSYTLSEIEELKKQLAAIKAENDSLKAENKALKEENTKLQNSNNSYKAANSKKQTDNKNLLTENATLKAANTELENKVANLENVIDTLKGGNFDNDTVNNANSDIVTIQAE